MQASPKNGQTITGEYIAVEWEGEVEFKEYLRDSKYDPIPFYFVHNGLLHETPLNNSGYTKIWWIPPRFLTLEGKKIRIIDAIKISVQRADALLLLEGFPYEPIEEPHKRRGIAIFPAYFLEPDEPYFGYFSRKILRCIANRAGKESPALEQIRDIAETISGASPADEQPAPDAAETVDVKTGAGEVVLPDGLDIKKESKKNGRALDAYFIEKILSCVKYIHNSYTDIPDIWEQPTKTQAHRNRDLPWTVFEWEGIEYRVWKQTKSETVYAVKLEIQEQETVKNRIFDYKKDG